MRRVFALMSALLMLLLFSCAPDNIKTPPSDNANDNQQTSASEQESSMEQNEKAEPEQQTSNDIQSDEDLTDGARYLKNKTKNDHIRPTADIDGQNIVAFKTPQLRGIELSFYTPEDSAFSAGSMDEKEWFDSLEKEYGLKLSYTLRSDKTLYSSQLIAVKAGKNPDIISTKVNDCAAMLSLMQSAKDIVTLNDSAPLSSRIFELTGGKLFTARGNSRVLWYNKKLTGESDPFKLYTENLWTTDKLSVIYNGMDVDANRLLECDSWLSFGSAGKTQGSGISGGGYVIALTDETVIDSFEAFGTLFNKDGGTADGDYSFKAGNTLFMFADTPAKGDFELGWTPVPKFTDEGRYIGEFCGTAMGLSGTIAEDKRGAAAAFMTLWSARYSESRADGLIHDIGLSPTEADSYLTFCEQSGGLYNADMKIEEKFLSDKMPVELYGSPDTVYNTFGEAYVRAAEINSRYK